jgi:beta-N-acetylhexosaminidase
MRPGARLVVLGAACAVLTGCGTALPEVPREPWAVAGESVPVDPVAEYAEARLATMTLAEKAASLLMIHIPGTDPGPIRSAVDAGGVAGVIYMGDNVPGSVSELATSSAALSRDPGLPVLIAIDQEGGIVRRLPDDTAASPAQLRAQGADAARVAFASRAALVASAGVTINFGIVADVTADPDSFIFSRVLGIDAAGSAPRVAAAVSGELGIVLSTLKHFPGHGSVAGDSHVSIPTTTMSYDTWRATQAPPFEAGIAAGAELVMLGHLRYSAVDNAPATLSAEWVRILREDLDFDGVIVTDDMTMLERSGEPAYADPRENTIAAIAAGDTLVLFVGPVDVPGIVAAVVAAVDAGRLDEGTVDAAALRLLELRRTESGRTGPYVVCAELCRGFVD